jgi:hypothetical protein
MPMPRLCDVFRTKYMETINAGMLISKIQVDLSIDPSTSRHCRNVRCGDCAVSSLRATPQPQPRRRAASIVMFADGK